jgi:hypothetical protein
MMMLAAPLFTLGWTHSVEKTGWQEDWRIAGDRLVLETARVKGSGAGMDPGEGARLEGGWWVWHPRREVQRLSLAASGATGDGWHLCSGEACRVIGAQSGAPLMIEPCRTDG